jgi:spore coat protein U-like protein
MNSVDTDDFLDYELYQDPDDGNTHSGTAKNFPLTNGNNTITVHGLMPGNKNVAGGDYSDTVQISLAFN